MNAARRWSRSPAASRCCTRRSARSSQGIIDRKKFVYLCTNALLLEKKLDQYKPSPFFTWSVHLDGDQEEHDRSVCQDGVYDRAVAAIKAAKAARLPRQHQLHAVQQRRCRSASRNFFDDVMAMGVDGITVSPGYAYERAPDQQHFLNRQKTKQLFRDIFKRGDNGKRWSFSQSTLFLDFLAGNQTYHCTPWGNPTRTFFGWQRPCYLLGEGYAKTFKELMEETDWDKYGTGNYEKCADCMVHSGYEASAVAGHVPQPAEGAAWSACAASAPRGRWRRTSRSTGSARPNTCSPPMSRRRWRSYATPRRSRPRAPAAASSAAIAALLCRPRRISAGS